MDMEHVANMIFALVLKVRMVILLGLVTIVPCEHVPGNTQFIYVVNRLDVKLLNDQCNCLDRICAESKRRSSCYGVFQQGNM